MSRLVLASGNADKLRELSAILEGTGISIVPMIELEPGWDVVEDGVSLRENALKKARDASRRTGLPAVADDSGLFVRCLGGAPGVYSSRYAGASCSYADNVDKLLRAIDGEADHTRDACFRTAAALVMPDGTELCVEGVAEGRIARQPSGSRGFGYDPVFYSTELGKTFAECSIDEKNAVSHRAKAFRALRSKILQLMNMAGVNSRRES